MVINKTPTPFSPREDAIIIQRRKEGVSYSWIGKELHRSKNSIRNHYLRFLLPGATSQITITVPHDRKEEITRIMKALVGAMEDYQ